MLTAFRQTEFRLGADQLIRNTRVSVRVATIFFGHCGPIELTAFDKHHRLIGSFYSAKRTAGTFNMDTGRSANLPPKPGPQESNLPLLRAGQVGIDGTFYNKLNSRLPVLSKLDTSIHCSMIRRRRQNSAP
ncbi:hypothetical protein T11_13588 [Trichinella zimbabwensis]|uniref:Uncharacterized protein n=1 Tax=Trichinella zimbabwensis TaxID=268475 RepID=A0A0V1I0Y7_9BILA|nr:hypothetical protein T11_13588 [Trichinella zimbabwensis]